MSLVKPCLALALVGGAIATLPTNAQVVREEGAKPIVGVLFTVPAPQRSFAQWTFKSAGGEVLFASLDADIYRIQTEHHETLLVPPSAASGEEEEGGPGLFRLKVIDGQGVEICSASRPAPPPGWQRDPRLACVMPMTRTQATYALRVELANPEGEILQPYYPFLLNVSIRGIAPNGVNIQEAFARSGTGGF